MQSAPTHSVIRLPLQPLPKGLWFCLFHQHDYPRDAFKITANTLVTYLDRGGSGKELRPYFCSTCGSPLYTETDTMPNFTIVKAGTLNDTTNFKPNINIFCESKMDWLKQCNKTVDFEKAPSQ